jgi:hypothetical protein
MALRLMAGFYGSLLARSVRTITERPTSDEPRSRVFRPVKQLDSLECNTGAPRASIATADIMRPAALYRELVFLL